jgi:hypothetical protein
VPRHRCDIGSYVNFRVFITIRDMEGGVGPTHKTSGPYPLNIRGGITLAIINPVLQALEHTSSSLSMCGIWLNWGWGDGEMGRWGDGEMGTPQE